MSDWVRVRRGSPCPICERSDWCLVSEDGGAAICARIESPRRCGEAGWLHRLPEDGGPRGPRIRTFRFTGGGAPRLDFAVLAQRFAEDVDVVRLQQLSESLGVTVASLCRLGIGWSADHRAWSFPMADAAGNVLGIRLRRPDGRKYAVTGGREGLFLVEDHNDLGDRLLIVEGPTDAAALLDMGFVGVVGRPSCTGGIKLLVDLVRGRRPAEVALLADADEPGMRGAANLASVLVAYAAAVRVITPPNGIKDVRDWVRAGGRRADVELAIAAAPVRRLVLRSNKGVGHG